jgi:hypothetical protein
MKTQSIHTKIRKLAANAFSFGEDTFTDWPTSVYFEGKAQGFQMLIDSGVDESLRVRDLAQAESIRHWRAAKDPLKYQFFDGIAAAATEVIGLHLRVANSD